MIDAFDDFELDYRYFQLRKAGQIVPLERRVFDLIAYLIRERDRVVSSEEIFAGVWEGRKVSSGSLTVAMAAARKALGDSHKMPRLIETHPRRGYRFLGAVRSRPIGAPHEARRIGVDIQARVDAFVGRDAEMTVVADSFREASIGRTSVVFLGGEAGIGKSSLLARVGREVEGTGALVLEGKCREIDGGAAFRPWVQILRKCFRQRPRSEINQLLGVLAEEITRLIPEMSDGTQTHDWELPASRLRLFDAVSMLIRRLSERQTVVIVLDDLHRADKPSLLLLESLVSELRRVRLLVVGSHRTAETARDEFRSTTISRICRQAGCRVADLVGLDKIQVSELVSKSLGWTPDSVAIDRLCDLTGGNPFFLTQLIHAAGQGGVEALLGASLPTTIRDAVVRQIDGLSGATRELLQMASVVGPEFPALVLDYALGEGGPIVAALEEAVEARLIVPVENMRDSYRFAHVLVRDALYTRIETMLRAQLHYRVGCALERVVGSEMEDHFSELAHHFSLAAATGAGAEALRYSELAGERASRRLAYEEAAEHFRQALLHLERLTPQNDVRRGEILLARGNNLMKAGERSSARATFERVARLARQTGNWDQLSRAALGISPGLLAVEAGAPDALVLSLLRDALALVPEVAGQLQARLLARLGMALFWAGADQERHALSDQAWRLAERLEDQELQAYVVLARWFADWDPTACDSRWQIASELEQRRRDLKDPELEMLSELFSVTCLIERGDIDEFDRRVSAFGRLAEHLRQPEAIWYALLLRSMREILAGRFDQGETISRLFAEIGERVGDANIFHSRMAHRLVLAWERGQFNELVEIAREATDRYPEILGWRAALAWALSQAGRLDDARREFEFLAQNEFRNIARTMDWSVAISLLSEVCVSLGDLSRAAMLYELLLPLRHRFVMLGLCVMNWGCASRYLGLLAGLRGDQQRAADHFEEAIGMNLSIGASPWVAHAKFNYADCLMTSARPDELDQAADLLREARATAEELGMTSLLSRIATAEQRFANH